MRRPNFEADSRPFILALDDDFDVINIFRLGLEKYGLNIFGFTDPQLALEHFKINRERYAIIVSDIRMPTMNGYEFVKKVKEMKPTVTDWFNFQYPIIIGRIIVHYFSWRNVSYKADLI